MPGQAAEVTKVGAVLHGSPRQADKRTALPRHVVHEFGAVVCGEAGQDGCLSSGCFEGAPTAISVR
jgi:hypothetical protein